MGAHSPPQAAGLCHTPFRACGELRERLGVGGGPGGTFTTPSPRPWECCQLCDMRPAGNCPCRALRLLEWSSLGCLYPVTKQELLEAHHVRAYSTSSLRLVTSLQKRDCPRFTNEETEAHRGPMTCLHSWTPNEAESGSASLRPPTQRELVQNGMESAGCLQQGEKVRPGGSWCRVQQGGCHGTDQLIFVFFKTTSHHNRNCFICRCAAILRERRARGFVVAAQISQPPPASSAPTGDADASPSLHWVRPGRLRDS